MSKNWLIGILILVGLGVFSISSINKIPTQEEDVKAKWSQVLNQYKRRSDLVPQLVNTVKGAANFEKSTLDSVIKARSAVETAPAPQTPSNPEELKKFMAVQGQLGSTLSRLFALSENYPELKATQNFLTLQSQLEGTENRIAVAMRDYIQSVESFNVTIKTFPGLLWNKVFYHKEPLANFSVSAEEQKVPEVNFS